jgi:hypothetical protein
MSPGYGTWYSWMVSVVYPSVAASCLTRAVLPHPRGPTRQRSSIAAWDTTSSPSRLEWYAVLTYSAHSQQSTYSIGKEKLASWGGGGTERKRVQ